MQQVKAIKTRRADVEYEESEGMIWKEAGVLLYRPDMIAGVESFAGRTVAGDKLVCLYTPMSILARTLVILDDELRDALQGLGFDVEELP